MNGHFFASRYGRKLVRARVPFGGALVAALLLVAWPARAQAPSEPGEAQPSPEPSSVPPPAPTYPSPPSYPTGNASQPGTPPEEPSYPAEPPPEPSVPSALGAARQRGDWLSTLGLHVSLGLSFGGEELAELTYTDGTTATVHAGEGVSLMGGITFTPLWIGERIGLGLGLDAGWKYKSTSVDADASVALERFPLGASARGLIGLANAWHVLIAGGPVLELSPNFYGDGLLDGIDVEFEDALGGMVELGILWGRPRAFGWEITGRYTFLSYELVSPATGVGDLDASSGSINFTAHFFL
jgi:hypothetical protein